MITDKYRNYLVVMLVVILAFNTVDRLALIVSLQDIKKSLSLSDTELGLLSGIAFALFYSLMGVPIARLADRTNRIKVLAVTTGLCCLAVTLCATAQNFYQLILYRVGVAVGEAGCNPTANSLIASYFTREERPRATARFMLGTPLSALVGFFIAGLLNQYFGWRIMFVCLGVPGLLLAVVVATTLHDKRNRNEVDRSCTTLATREPQPGVFHVLKTLWKIKTFRHLLFSYAISAFFGAGIGKWQGAFFIRTFGLSTGELGVWFTVIYGIGGFLGVYWGGEFASKFAKNDERLQLRLFALIWLLLGGVWAAAYLSNNLYVTLSLMVTAVVVGATIYGPLFAVIQSLVPDHMRAQAFAIFWFFVNLIGGGIGPLLVGVMSDSLHAKYGLQSLRISLILFCPGYFWSAWHLLRASRTVSSELSVAQAAQLSFTADGRIATRGQA